MNYSADYTVHRQCGCQITWTGKSAHKKTRTMWCVDHAKYGQQPARQRIVDEAEERYSLDVLCQPPL